MSSSDVDVDLELALDDDQLPAISVSLRAKRCASSAPIFTSTKLDKRSLIPRAMVSSSKLMALERFFSMRARVGRRVNKVLHL